MTPQTTGGFRKPKRLSKLLWGFSAFYITYGTSTPFRFQAGPDFLRGRFVQIDWFPFGPITASPASFLADYLQNILLFLPFGFLGYVAIADKRARWKPFAVIALGCGLSAGVEFLQLFSETRHTALTDVFWNTFGAALGVGLGVRLRRTVLGLPSRPGLRRFLDAESAYPALIFGLIVAAGAWEPFNFALETAVGTKWQAVWTRFFAVGFSPGDLLALSRYACFSLFTCRLFREAGARRGRFLGALCAFLTGLSLECSQFIVPSRMPEFRDALILSAGVFLGFVAAFLPPFRRRPLFWSILFTAGFAAAIAGKNLYPYRFGNSDGDFNFVPFLPYYRHASFAALADFMQEVTAYFSIGVIGAYMLGKRALGFTLPAALLLSGSIETLQRALPGRNADITEILGAAVGVLAGHLAIVRGWNVFREYVRPVI